jgi:hypothetical protein
VQERRRPRYSRTGPSCGALVLANSRRNRATSASSGRILPRPENACPALLDKSEGGEHLRGIRALLQRGRLRVVTIFHHRRAVHSGCYAAMSPSRLCRGFIGHSIGADCL